MPGHATVHFVVVSVCVMPGCAHTCATVNFIESSV